MTRTPDALTTFSLPPGETPLGIRQPFLPPMPLGQPLLQPKFLMPLGIRSLTTLDPSVFRSAARSMQADQSLSFQDSPFFDAPERHQPSERSAVPSSTQQPRSLETVAGLNKPLASAIPEAIANLSADRMTAANNDPASPAIAQATPEIPSTATNPIPEVQLDEVEPLLPAPNAVEPRFNAEPEVSPEVFEALHPTVFPDSLVVPTSPRPSAPPSSLPLDRASKAHSEVAHPVSAPTSNLPASLSAPQAQLETNEESKQPSAIPMPPGTQSVQMQPGENPAILSSAPFPANPVDAPVKTFPPTVVGSLLESITPQHQTAISQSPPVLQALSYPVAKIESTAPSTPAPPTLAIASLPDASNSPAAEETPASEIAQLVADAPITEAMPQPRSNAVTTTIAPLFLENSNEISAVSTVPATVPSDSVIQTSPEASTAVPSFPESLLDSQSSRSDLREVESAQPSPDFNHALSAAQTIQRLRAETIAPTPDGTGLARKPTLAAAAFEQALEPQPAQSSDHQHEDSVAVQIRTMQEATNEPLEPFTTHQPVLQEPTGSEAWTVSDQAQTDAIPAIPTVLNQPVDGSVDGFDGMRDAFTAVPSEAQVHGTSFPPADMPPDQARSQPPLMGDTVQTSSQTITDPIAATEPGLERLPEHLADISAGDPDFMIPPRPPLQLDRLEALAEPAMQPKVEHSTVPQATFPPLQTIASPERKESALSQSSAFNPLREPRSLLDAVNDSGTDTVKLVPDPTKGNSSKQQSDALPALPTTVQRLSVWEPLVQLQPLLRAIDPPAIQRAETANAHQPPRAAVEELNDKPSRSSLTSLNEVEKAASTNSDLASTNATAAWSDRANFFQPSVETSPDVSQTNITAGDASRTGVPASWSSLADLFQAPVEVRSSVPPTDLNVSDNDAALNLYSGANAALPDVIQRRPDNAAASDPSPSPSPEAISNHLPASSNQSASPEQFEQLAQEVYRLVQQRLALERERVGHLYSRRSL